MLHVRCAFYTIKQLHGYCMVLVSEPGGEHHHCRFVFVSSFYVNCEIGSTFALPFYEFRIKKVLGQWHRRKSLFWASTYTMIY